MYSNQSLYYLQQLGICPWIRSDLSSQAEPQLLIFVPEALSVAAKELLNRIIAFIALEKNRMTLVELSTKSQPLSTSKKVLSLVFGEDLIKVMPQAVVPDIVTSDLELLINHPIQKRAVLEHLYTLKQLLNDAR